MAKAFLFGIDICSSGYCSKICFLNRLGPAKPSTFSIFNSFWLGLFKLKVSSRYLYLKAFNSSLYRTNLIGLLKFTSFILGGLGSLRSIFVKSADLYGPILGYPGANPLTPGM
eukprot:NODE_159_length_15043_cov_0.440444.p11 type:complete len:113 gc:universal NODE_159_length_15043_cov_0.440444:1241-903(-)